MMAACQANANVPEAETLPLLENGKAPTTVDETWTGFDPRREPLDVEVLKEWEEDGVVVKVIRYRVGIFKGRLAMMAAVFGYPKGAENLPGLIQLHGGGQSAQSSFVVKDAKNGYATLSMAWAGRINATEYTVSNQEKEMFWTGNTEDPDYRVTTDWGALDGYHHYCRFEGNTFVQNPPSDSTLDAVESPRNSGWFLATLGARRAITFLEQQPQVDGERIGVYGMSMGGKLTVLAAGADSRIKAAAPACGGLSDLSTEGKTLPALADDSYLARITCPTIIMSPSNDFHSQVQDIPAALAAMKTRDWRVVSSPNQNHGDYSEYAVGTLLWFDHALKGTFDMARTPQTTLTLKTADGSPTLAVVPDRSQEIRSVYVYYTQDGEREAPGKYWHQATPTTTGDTLTFQLPLLSIDKPLWAYADVEYALGRTVEGVGYSGEKVRTDVYQLASVVTMASAESLRQAGAVVSLDASDVHEDFNAFERGSDVKKAFPAFTLSDGISCVPDPGGRPGMSLELRDGPDFTYAWLPLLTLNTPIAPFLDTAAWTCQAEIMLDAKQPVPLIVEFRAAGHQKKFTPVIVDAAGAISARGETTTQLCSVKPGSWWSFSVRYDLNAPERFQVKIEDASGELLAEQSLATGTDIGAVNWIGFIADGTEVGSVYVDNFSLTEKE